MSNAVVTNELNVEPSIWTDAVRGEVAFRAIFGTEPSTPEFTAGVTDLEPGGWLGHHRHQPAELYYVIEGEGVLVIDGAEHVVVAGAAAYIPGDSEHGIRNTGDGRLRFFYAFAVGAFDPSEYVFTANA